MALYQYGSSSKAPEPSRTTEFEVLKASHKFLREEDEKELSWEDQMARKYYASLYREFAVCDLKHYKSGNFALRWRTESEVLSGAGEETCGNTRCAYHAPSRTLRPPPMKTLELPFAYEERGARQSALVKVVLCDRCSRKLMWKREREKEAALLSVAAEAVVNVKAEDESANLLDEVKIAVEERSEKRMQRKRRPRETDAKPKRGSRSCSPVPHTGMSSPIHRRRSRERVQP